MFLTCEYPLRYFFPPNVFFLPPFSPHPFPPPPPYRDLSETSPQCKGALATFLPLFLFESRPLTTLGPPFPYSLFFSRIMVFFGTASPMVSSHQVSFSPSRIIFPFASFLGNINSLFFRFPVKFRRFPCPLFPHSSFCSSLKHPVPFGPCTLGLGIPIFPQPHCPECNFLEPYADCPCSGPPSLPQENTILFAFSTPYTEGTVFLLSSPVFRTQS